MTIRISCPKCGKKYNAKDEMMGKTVRCKICSGPIWIPQVGEAQIMRHEARTRDFTLAIGDEEAIDAISRHIETHLGPIDSVFHEIISDLVHLDVYVVKPTAERPWVTFITSGMSSLPMTVPEGREEMRFAELIITLPEDWPLEQSVWEDENHYWPVRWLKTLARLPHEYETWLGFCHTVPNGDPPESLAESTDFCGFILLPPLSAPEGFRELQAGDEKTIHFYSIVPLYPEEMEFKVARGADALLERFEKYEIGDVVDLRRRNTCRRK
jgi:ribosomal protein S27E